MFSVCVVVELDNDNEEAVVVVVSLFLSLYVTMDLIERENGPCWSPKKLSNPIILN